MLYCAGSNLDDSLKLNQYWLDCQFKPFRSQKFIIELWLVDTLKSPIKIGKTITVFVNKTVQAFKMI